jgi:hypothetical protein
VGLDESRRLRFGVSRGDGSPGGANWQVHSAATKRSVVVSGTAPESLYVSLHEDKWFVRWRPSDNPNGSALERLEPAAPITPGTVHAVSLGVHGSWGSYRSPLSEADASRVRWAVAPPGDFLVFFDMFLQTDQAALAGWPGDDPPLHTSKLVGTLPIFDGGRVCVVSHVEHPETYMAEGDELVRGISALWERGEYPEMLLIGASSDGAVAIRIGQLVPARGGD